MLVGSESWKLPAVASIFCIINYLQKILANEPWDKREMINYVNYKKYLLVFFLNLISWQRYNISCIEHWRHSEKIDSYKERFWKTCLRKTFPFGSVTVKLRNYKKKTSCKQLCNFETSNVYKSDVSLIKAI